MEALMEAKDLAKIRTKAARRTTSTATYSSSSAKEPIMAWVNMGEKMLTLLMLSITGTTCSGSAVEEPLSHMTATI